MKQSHQLNRRAVALGLGAALLGTNDASAQGWLSKGKGFFKKLGGGGSNDYTLGEAATGLKDTLRVASDRVVSRVGAADGYLLDDAIHIPLPKTLETTRKVLAPIGASGMLDDLEVQLNRGAETAAPFARDIFWDSITAMTIDDAIGIVNGPNDSATRYFEKKMTPQLTETFHPIVEESLDQSGAIKSFDRVAESYDNVPFAPSLGASAKGSLIDHGVQFALGGIFHYLGSEEKKIRQNPLGTMESIVKIFG